MRVYWEDEILLPRKEEVYKCSALKEDICILNWTRTITVTVFLFQGLHLHEVSALRINGISCSFTFRGDKACVKKMFILRVLCLPSYCNNRLNAVPYYGGGLCRVVNRLRGTSFYMGLPWCHCSKSIYWM